ncbi:MAG: Ig-like domain-containing protein, partial [Verrucomicrobiota bacterium]|nr:Ig-like domain-containing protein [Verrucomicrobiota bacterium]
MTLTLPSGKTMIANPLDNGGNRVSDLLPNAPVGSTLSKFNPTTGNWVTNTFTGAWSQPGMTLEPGEGALFDNKGDEFSVLLAGFTPWRKTALSIPSGDSVVSSALAKGGLLSSRLGLPIAEGLVVKLLNNATGNYDTYTVVDGAWSPSEPSVSLGQAFLVTVPSAITWSPDPTLPQLTSQPSGVQVLSGDKAGFIVKAVGEPLTYQWLFEGKPINGATASAIQLPETTIANAGRYSVLVSNVFGKVVSEPARLDIYYKLQLALEGRGGIAVEPQKSVFLAGSLATLSATPASGYSWMYWSGDATGNDETITVTMDDHKTITANFSRDYILPDLSDAGFDDKGRFVFLLSSEPGANCQIQSSSDGVLWYKLADYQNKKGLVRIPMAYNAGVERQFVRVLVEDELAPGRIAGHSHNGVGYINLDIPPGQSFYHVPLVLSGSKTVAALFQGAAKGSKLALFDPATGEWAEGELGDTWSNAAAEIGQGSIFKFTNPDSKPFRVVFVGSYAGKGAEVTLAKGTEYFGYPSPLSGAVGYDLQFPASAPAGTKVGFLEFNGVWWRTVWHTYDGTSWSPKEPSLSVMQAAQVQLPEDFTWSTYGMPDFNSKPKLRAITGGGTYLAGTETLQIGLDAIGTPMAIQWTKDNQAIVGATESQLQLVNLGPSHAGRYAVTLRNAFGIENSNPVEVNVHYSLTTIVAEGRGKIEVDPALESYPPGTIVTLTARPGEGLGFDGWEGDVSGLTQSVKLVMDDHKTVSIRYIADNQPPTVVITSPKNGQFFSAPSDIEISINAADNDGSIKQILYERKLVDAVEWTSIGQATDAAASFTWEGASDGVYQIRATVTDNRGAIVESASVQVTLTTGNLPPVIISTTPTEGDYLPMPGKFIFKVVAFDPDGDVKSIRINEDYAFTKANGPDYWTENDKGQSVLTDIRWENFTYDNSTLTVFTVDVEDNQGAVTTQKVRFTVNHAPSIEITSPLDGTEFIFPVPISLAA